MPDVILSTLNAKYIHASFGLRYLLANLGDLQSRTSLLEFDINQRPLDIAEVLLAQNPRILGLGIYIWNVAESTRLVAALKRIRPGLIVVLGGPEVSFETDQQEIIQLADHTITGEADLKFAEVCRTLLADPMCRLPRIIPADLPQLKDLRLPYDLYTDDDVKHRVVYVEASRGCPFTCEFCLSALDVPVRQFPLPVLLPQLQALLDRGLLQFKFVDRTFNLNPTVSRTILQFFLDRLRPGLFVHFEMVPDRLPAPLREIIAKFPPGALQFEVGVQTLDPETAKGISRQQDYSQLDDNFRFLREQTGVHIHADLIAGLPGESLESFAAGFDRLVALRPQEIQVGILKRLRGTPIVRHDTEWQMLYNPQPPYEILQNKLLDFAAMQRLRRFARYWDLVANSGNFVESTPLIWSAGSGSPFWSFLRFSDWLFGRIGRNHSIALANLGESIFRYLTEELGIAATQAAHTLWDDWQRGGHHERPAFLQEYISDSEVRVARARLVGPKRQARHLAPTDHDSHQNP
jgi:radical SAM superfamily enzyme YgiQ (UPF0313 family)